MRKIFTILLLSGCSGVFAQSLAPLTIEKIMRDPKWIGTSPSNIRWSDDSKKIYFNWNPENADRDPLFAITPSDIKPVKVSLDEQRAMAPEYGDWNKKHTQKLFEKNGDIWLSDLPSHKIQQLTNTADFETGAVFSGDESKVIFRKGDNLYSLNLHNGELAQLTNFVHSAAAAAPAAQGRRGRKANQDVAAGNEQERWLKAQQLELFDIIKVRDKDRKLDSVERKEFEVKKLKEIAVDDRSVGAQRVSPDGRYITYRLAKYPEGVKSAIVPNYVTASGFTEDIPNRTKVGDPQPVFESYVFDTRKDTVYKIVTSTLPGIKDLPDYVKDYPKELERRTKANEDRRVNIQGPYWSEDSKYAVVFIEADDNKDRWIMRLDPATGALSLMDRERNEAWVGGPGQGARGYVDNSHFYYETEESGYAHIYVYDFNTSTKKQLTNGKWEVQTLQLSKDKKTFYFTANMEHPGVNDFYRMPVTGGQPVKLTGMKGGNEVTLSPDEKWLAIRYSYSNKPWELYIQPNKPGAKAVKVTNSVTEEFKSYNWREPQVITFKNRYGSDVYARLYVPEKQDPAKPAVVFVHGAGYLQNAHYWWSLYFREYMFNNMLADNGYTVLDIDYSGSAGYGRDWRTAIYRHMGGKDLTDQEDGVKMLVEKYGVNPKHVGLYGGSYGGFITLMAMFTEPDTWAAGGAIRSVTDWAHYNHGYTSAILNEPYNDEKAYRISSPIYFANGLKGNLLMLHGMIDQNVNYQDIVRLSQRLIELHKENWELASYPVEDHGFVQPSSWTDEYKRIFKLFETTLRK
ncbi:prolyl oligopeptidase family serine peptidase [Mucilaginibacter sp. L3T2-6]|uniref:prolyl oligopeptidase family serine peptidase n=1 Tax=Mucilaginibacter sp. L3T2-6 TaxID=3062491 RepID=UPI0026754066|nr:prolyl oligopeptidase family serine peptidase [Mucilaginibacter sp. L3T2-6]MDO3645067.1 prolyl oligopeptidase family serine peptidase [Mucilaginibacter sp. L3T2-6]MDV6217518.1 prolyl oligopeptidase family serine peptidase [Mucilaginibacter sp. L3T2-6]